MTVAKYSIFNNMYNMFHLPLPQYSYQEGIHGDTFSFTGVLLYPHKTILFLFMPSSNVKTTRIRHSIIKSRNSDIRLPA